MDIVTQAAANVVGKLIYKKNLKILRKQSKDKTGDN
jgi:hypothetical protein